MHEPRSPGKLYGSDRGRPPDRGAGVGLTARAGLLGALAGAGLFAATAGLLLWQMQAALAPLAEAEREAARLEFAAALETEWARTLEGARRAAGSALLASQISARSAERDRRHLRAALTAWGGSLAAVYDPRSGHWLAAAATRPMLSSPQVLTSEPVQALIRATIGAAAKVPSGSAVRFAMVQLYDDALLLTALPVGGGDEGPVLLWGHRLPPSLLTAGGRQLVLELPRLDGAREARHPPEGTGGYRLYAPGGAPLAGALHVVPAPRRRFGQLHALVPWLALGGAGALFAGALFGALAARRIARPLQEIVARAENVLAGERWQPPPTPAGEARALADACGRLAGALAAARAEGLAERERLDDFARSSSDWLWETDAEGRFTYVSAGIQSTLGIDPARLVGQPAATLLPDDALRPCIERGGTITESEVWIEAQDGTRRCLRLNAMPFRHGGHLAGCRGSARDVTQNKRDQDHLLQLATRDHLTGLLNRSRFMDEFSRELELTRRHGYPGALLLIDLDHFKLVNDTAGHAAGDEILIQVAGLLQRVTRRNDLVARLSGDEFVVVLVHCDPDQAGSRAEQILDGFRSLRPIYGGKVLDTSASIGMVDYPEHGTDPAELLGRADSAMYEAKRLGRNRLHRFRPSDLERQEPGSQLAWKERIHHALDQDLLELVLQPVVALHETPAPRYEVLLRMRSEDGRQFGPASFIPLAERFGLIRDIDLLVVRKALALLGQERYRRRRTRFSINLSGLSVGDEEILTTIERALREHPVDPEQVIFEVTESAACEDMTRATEFIRHIQELGCRIALDDFGVGFSSFSYLKHLGPDFLKIDGSFIRNIAANPHDQLFVKALVDVARGMHIRTIAEFVEDAECLELIRGLGVDYAQGYFLGRPAPPGD